MIQNRHFEKQIKDDTEIKLYHLDIFQEKQYYQDEFSDIKIVCIGGKPSRMRELAKIWRTTCNGNCKDDLYDYSIGGDRYSMFKYNQILFLSHGIGIPSILIVLNEVTKLLNFAGVTDAVFIRFGTCGGLDLRPGTIVISEDIFDSKLDQYHEMFICGISVKRPAILDKSLGEEFFALAQSYFGETFNQLILKSNTMCTNDFYEEQARMDGAYNGITSNEREIFFKKIIKDFGIRNIEMESMGFAAFCHNLGIKGMVVSMVIVDRMITDNVMMTIDEIKQHEEVLNKLFVEYFKSKLKF